MSRQARLLRRELRREARDLVREGHSREEAKQIISDEYGEEMSGAGIDISFIMKLIEFFMSLFNRE